MTKREATLTDTLEQYEWALIGDHFVTAAWAYQLGE